MVFSVKILAGKSVQRQHACLPVPFRHVVCSRAIPNQIPFPQLTSDSPPPPPHPPALHSELIPQQIHEERGIKSETKHSTKRQSCCLKWDGGGGG
jgi:hypothetical protein